MAHSFLMEAGIWLFQGNWLENNQLPLAVKGKISTNWNQEDWFAVNTTILFIEGTHEPITLKYKGKLNQQQKRYTYVLQHSILGNVEGEGWIAPSTIIQRYWVLGGDDRKRGGFETFYRLNNNTYHLACGILAGHYLSSTMEATLERQS